MNKLFVIDNYVCTSVTEINILMVQKCRILFLVQIIRFSF